MVYIPSPAVAVVGRHNSGKTTLVERLIAELVARGLDVGSVKHHSHAASISTIQARTRTAPRRGRAGGRHSAPGQMACIKSIEGELECADFVRGMPGHDIVVVEGYRKSGLPTIEIMRAANESDARAASCSPKVRGAGWPLGADFTQLARERVVVERGAYRAALGAGSLDTSACELAASGRV